MVDNNIKIKIDLLVNGVQLAPNTKDFLINNYGKKFYNDDYVTTSGVMIEIDENTYVTSHISDNSNYIINLSDNKFLLFFNNVFISEIKIWEPCDYMVNVKENKYGPITKYVNSHFDRSRINPISGCNNHCAFCSMNEIPYRKNTIEQLDLALEESLKDERITHVLISGGSPKEQDLEYLTEVYEYFAQKYKNYKIDVMMTPRGFTSYTDTSQYEEYLKHLKKIGVAGLSINIELFNDEICEKYCREKFKIGKQNYLLFLKLASKIFGTTNVRSGLIVGLEPMQDTLDAVEEICKCGCMPMLSPYIPYKGIGDFPTAEFLIETLEKTNEILSKYNISLAPLCKMCKHNTI